MGVFEEAVERLTDSNEGIVIESDYCLADDDSAYTEAELFFHRILWELSCGLITRDWSRVQNAVRILTHDEDRDKPIPKKRGRKPKYAKGKEA